jgi:hypothetical protein
MLSRSRVEVFPTVPERLIRRIGSVYRRRLIVRGSGRAKGAYGKVAQGGAEY